MKKLVILLGASVLLISCGGSDCNCDEIVKKEGKWYKSGIYKDGDRATFGELYTGTCETKNGEGKTTETGEYNNGFLISNKVWQDVDGELYQVRDLKYKDGKRSDGFNMKLGGHYGYLYTEEYREYKDGEELLWYQMSGEEMIGDASDNSFDLPNGNCLLQGYDINESEMKAFLECVSKENLPKFFYKKRK